MTALSLKVKSSRSLEIELDFEIVEGILSSQFISIFSSTLNILHPNMPRLSFDSVYPILDGRKVIKDLASFLCFVGVGIKRDVCDAILWPEKFLLLEVLLHHS